MADYQETTAQGKAWKRCSRIIIDNPLGGTPSIRFYEQDVVTIGDKTIAQDATTCQSKFMAEMPIPILDPATLLHDGSAVYTHAQLYSILFSLYMAVAKARDMGVNEYTDTYGVPSTLVPSELTPPGV